MSSSSATASGTSGTMSAASTHLSSLNQRWLEQTVVILKISLNKNMCTPAFGMFWCVCLRIGMGDDCSHDSTTKLNLIHHLSSWHLFSGEPQRLMRLSQNSKAALIQRIALDWCIIPAAKPDLAVPGWTMRPIQPLGHGKSLSIFFVSLASLDTPELHAAIGLAPFVVMKPLTQRCDACYLGSRELRTITIERVAGSFCSYS